MKRLRNKKRYLRAGVLVVCALIVLALAVGLYHANKPLPQGISFAGNVHTLAAEDIEFLYDLTYHNASGARVVEQEIFARVFELVEHAERLIVIDAFLFNDDYVSKERLIPITTELKKSSS